MDTEIPLEEIFYNLFVGRRDCYGTYVLSGETDDNGKQKGIAKTHKQELTKDHFKAHLCYANQGIGIIPILPGNKVRFGVIDIDEYSEIDYKEVCKKLKELPFIPCRSKSGGLHIYIFLKEEVGAAAVTKKLRLLASYLGVAKNSNGRSVEIFPKQIHYNPDAVGNWINIPYNNYQNTERYAFNHLGEKMTIMGFVQLAVEKSLSLAEFRDLKIVKEDPAMLHGPPCLTTLHDIGIGQGSRNTVLFNFGIYYRKRFGRDKVEQKLKELNDSLSDPLPLFELSQLVTQVSGEKTYTYQCNESPLCDHCDRKSCYGKKYGIVKDSCDLEYGDMHIVKGSNPIYFWNINGKEIDYSAEELVSLQKFRTKTLRKANVVVPMMKQDKFDQIVNQALQSATETIIEYDEGDPYIALKNTLIRWLTANEAQGLHDIPQENEKVRQAIKAERSVRIGNKFYFCMDDFIEYLQIMKFREIPKNQIASAVHKIYNTEKKRFCIDSKARFYKMVTIVWINPDDFREIEIEEEQESCI